MGTRYLKCWRNFELNVYQLSMKYLFPEIQQVDDIKPNSFSKYFYGKGFFNSQV